MTATAIKEQPIDLTVEEIKAILDGQMNRLARPIQPQPERSGDGWLYEGQYYGDDDSMKSHLFHDVYGTKGTPYGSVYGDGTADRLWVREVWRVGGFEPLTQRWVIDYLVGGTAYKACDFSDPSISNYFNGTGQGARRRSAEEMPRWASRLTLELVDVDVEFQDLWQWAITFKRIG